MLFEPLHIAANEEHVFLGFGGAEHHGLQRDRIRFVELEAAKISNALTDSRVIGWHTGVEQGKCAECGHAAVVAGKLTPATARLLVALEISDAAVDRADDLGGIDMTNGDVLRQG